MTGGVKEIVCLYEDKSILKTYQEMLFDIVDPEELKQKSAKVSGIHLSSFVKNKKADIDCSEILIPSSCGVHVALEAEVVKRFMDDGIHILGINQCEKMLNEQDHAKQQELIKMHTMNFVTGKTPTWEVFMLSEPAKCQITSIVPSCLVERIHTKRIQDKVKDMEKIDKKSVALASILHNPGAGATTIGKHVLWNLKDSFRCAYLDGKFIENIPLKKVSEMILLYRKIKEKDSQASGTEGPGCKTVLLFLDNTSLDFVKNLRMTLEQAVDAEKIKYNKTNVIISRPGRSQGPALQTGL